MNNAPMKPGMRQRLSRPNMSFWPVNRKVQPKTASLAQRKTIDAGRRFVGKYTAADLVSGNGTKARRVVSGASGTAGASGASGASESAAPGTASSQSEAKVTARGGATDGARVTARGPSANVASGSADALANVSGARKVDDEKAEMRPDFRPSFVRKKKQGGEF